MGSTQWGSHAAYPHTDPASLHREIPSPTQCCDALRQHTAGFLYPDIPHAKAISRTAIAIQGCFTRTFRSACTRPSGLVANPPRIRAGNPSKSSTRHPANTNDNSYVQLQNQLKQIFPSLFRHIAFPGFRTAEVAPVSRAVRSFGTGRVEELAR